jgi:hypothetical protein
MMADGQLLQGHILALSVSDASGQRIWLGQLKDCAGELDSAKNQVTYRDAFQGIQADVRYSYGLTFFEQDVIIRDNPIIPAPIDIASARLEAWSEFIQPPEPRKEVRIIKWRTSQDVERSTEGASANDEDLDFGCGAKAGPAAAGWLAEDVWNLYQFPWQYYGELNNLLWFNGSGSSVRLTVQNAPGTWGN